jgi:NitT/TauT family transport system substrate-binding protein
MPILTRRSMLLSAAAAVCCAGAARPASAAPVADLAIYAAPSGSSVVLAHLIESGGLSDVAPGATLKIWHDPDELRAGIASGHAAVFNAPSNLAANLYNRGVAVRLLDILGMGHLYVMTTDPGVNALADVKGRTIGLFFKNDMPDLVFRSLARRGGLEAGRDYQVIYAATHMEAAQLLIAGKVDTAVLPEPMASAALLMGGHHGVAVRRAIDLQDVWRTYYGAPARIPMAGIAVTDALRQQSPEFVAALHRGAIRSAAWLAEHPDAAGELAVKYLGLHAHIAAESLKHFGIEVVSARDMRADLETFYNALAAIDPGSIGGHLPDEGFYLNPSA